MNSMQAMRLEMVGKTVLIVILLPMVLSRPWTQKKDNSLLRSKMPEFGDSRGNEAEFRRAMNNYLFNKEYNGLRKMLKLSIRILDNKEGHREESDVLRNLNKPDMPFYFDHFKSLVSGEGMKRRNHRRRRGFDSIGHRASGLGGLGGSYSYTGRKVEYTLEQLLPFIIAELRRNEKFGVSEVNF